MTLPGGDGGKLWPGTGTPDPAGCRWGSGELVPVPDMIVPSLRSSITASSAIRKNCHVPWGESVQSSRAETSLPGIWRNPRIAAVQSKRSSGGALTFERVRRTLTNHVQNPEKIIKSNGSPAFAGASHNLPRLFAIPVAISRAFIDGLPLVMGFRQPPGFGF